MIKNLMIHALGSWVCVVIVRSLWFSTMTWQPWSKNATTAVRWGRLIDGVWQEVPGSVAWRQQFRPWSNL